jgi:hypothetical protein
MRRRPGERNRPRRRLVGRIPRRAGVTVISGSSPAPSSSRSSYGSAAGGAGRVRPRPRHREVARRPRTTGRARRRGGRTRRNPVRQRLAIRWLRAHAAPTTTANAPRERTTSPSSPASPAACATSSAPCSAPASTTSPATNSPPEPTSRSGTNPWTSEGTEQPPRDSVKAQDLLVARALETRLPVCAPPILGPLRWRSTQGSHQPGWQADNLESERCGVDGSQDRG